MKQLPKEEQFYYEKDGQWLAFNKEQSDLGAAKTYDDFLEATKPSIDESFAIDMNALNSEYDQNMASVVKKYNIAVARDGSQETEKVASARAEITELDNQYEIDQLALINKHYGV